MGHMGKWLLTGARDAGHDNVIGHRAGRAPGRCVEPGDHFNLAWLFSDGRPPILADFTPAVLRHKARQSREAGCRTIDYG